jgi:hypothetical protein
MGSLRKTGEEPPCSLGVSPLTKHLLSYHLNGRPVQEVEPRCPSLVRGMGHPKEQGDHPPRPRVNEQGP